MTAALLILCTLCTLGGIWAFVACLHRDPAGRWARETGDES